MDQYCILFGRIINESEILFNGYKTVVHVKKKNENENENRKKKIPDKRKKIK